MGCTLVSKSMRGYLLLMMALVVTSKVTSGFSNARGSRLFKRANDAYGAPKDNYHLFNYLGPQRLQRYYGGPGYGRNPYSDRGMDKTECPDYEPFRCPQSDTCISIQYLCDGAPDCPKGRDEKASLCTAAKRPPVEETASFLTSLLASHGPNYLVKLFGVKARSSLEKLGGVKTVAIALSESQTIDEFGTNLHLSKNDVDHLRSVFMAVENGDIGLLKSLGIKDSELGDVKFFLEKLVNTGFLD